MPTDDELLAAWGRGETLAGEALTRRHYANVLRFFDIRATAQAEDLTQKTFLTCLEKRQNMRELGSFRSFLFGIARNHLLHHIRGAARRHESSEFDDFANEQPSPSRIVAMYDEQRLLLRAFQTISLDAQQVLQLFYWEQLQTSEIASALGIPISTVTTRISRARKSLLAATEKLAAVEHQRKSLLGDFDRWLASFSGLYVSGVMPERH